MVVSSTIVVLIDSWLIVNVGSGAPPPPPPVPLLSDPLDPPPPPLLLLLLPLGVESQTLPILSPSKSP